MIKKILTGVLILFVTATIAVFATSISTVDASPLLDDPTPTPIVTYWSGPSASFTWSQGMGANVGLDGLGSAPWLDDIDGEADYIDLFAPLENQPAGILLTLNSTTYNGDARIHEMTNTDFSKKFNDKWGDPTMSPGETICIGTSAGCTAMGYSVDPDADWEGVAYDDPYYHIEDIRIYTELGSSGSISFSVTPFWYGEWNCTYIEVEDRELISTGLLLGPDDEGESFDLIPNQEYVLGISGGPWNDGTDDRYDAGVRFRSAPTDEEPFGEWGEWAELSTLTPSGDICNPDAMGANGTLYMFEADPETQAEIQFRVNDTDGEFDDNTGDIEYYWMAGLEGTGLGCERQWTRGSKVAGGTANSATISKIDLSAIYSGGTFNGRVAGNEFYEYVVTGTFMDNGTPSNDTSVWRGLSYEYTDPADAFYPTNDFCENETAESIAFYGETLSAWDDTDNVSYRGFDPWLEFNGTNPTGNVTVEWYESSWTAPPSDCGSKYDIGTFIESPIFFADNEDGKEYPIQTVGLVEGQAYYLESQGTPYYLNGTPSYDFEVGYPIVDGSSVGVQWLDPEEFFDCITPLDQDRNGYYWIAETENFWLRAEKSGFPASHDNNSGTLKFNLYGAIPNDVPEGESCGDYYDLDHIVWRDSFDADENSGYNIDQSHFTAGERYAVKITGAYTEPDGDGKSGEIRRYAHGMTTPDWSDFSDWEAGLCYEEDGSGFDVVYFEATEWTDYEIRANTPIGNTGTLSFEVWGLEQTQLTVTGCEYNYADVEAWYWVKQGEAVEANNPGAEYDGDGNVTAVTGYVMANSFTDDVLRYKIELGWLPLDNLTDAVAWDLQISGDGGQTWVFLEDWVDCWVDLGSPEARGYFSAPVDDPGPFILRVYDVAGIYFNNAGGVNFNMWVESASDSPGDIWTDPYNNPYAEVSWGAGCTAVCVRPTFLDGGLSVGAWVEYARCRLTQWLAWCPEHAEAMGQMREAFEGVEPFKTIFELVDLTALVREEIDSYSWNDDGGGSGEYDAQIQTPPNYIFMPGEGGGAGVDPGALTGPDSIWGEGEIDLSPSANSGYNFRTECNTELSETLGTRIAPALCFGVNVLDQLGLKLWFQMFWDMFMFVGLVMYIKKSWVDPLS